MAQNIYDDPDFFTGYSQLPRSQHGLAGAPEWPSIRALVPDLTGKRVVDLGCGFGWFSRWAAEYGASSVLGLDLSEKMLARARNETDDGRVVYERADLESLVLPEAAFDFAYSALAFHYVEDFARLAGSIWRALTPASKLVFSIEHPIFMAPADPGWIEEPDGKPAWRLNRYSDEGRRTTNWFADGVVKYHRKLATTLNLLIDAGFAIEHVNEWGPTAAQVVAQPSLVQEIDRPMMVIVRAGRV